MMRFTFQYYRYDACYRSIEGKRPGRLRTAKRLIDVQIEELLGKWEPQIGSPTCGPGCSACCERMTVIVSSDEALQIVDEAPEFAEGVDALVERLPVNSTLDDVLDLGPCVFLSDQGHCQIYDSRPDACRACYVWHEARFCGREDFDMCTPAELNSLRLRHLHERMTEEFTRGRQAFRGFLLPAVWMMRRYRKEYLQGDDISRNANPDWLRAEIVEFPTIDQLHSEKSELDAVFRKEENPMGFPRASRAKDRSLLAAFDLRV